KGIPLVGGITLAGGSLYLQYRNDATFADDYLAGYAEINLFTAVYRFGAKYNFDGTAELLSASPLADVPPSAGAVSAQAGVSRSFSVPADSGPIVLSAAWQNAAATIPAFRVTGPRGVSYTNADSGNGSVEIVPGLSSDTRLTVAVRAPAAGTWTLELPQPEALGAVTIEGAGAAPAPSVAVTAPAGTVSGDAVTL